MIRTCTATIQGVSPYSPSRFLEEPKRPGEDGDAYERRTWRLKAHADKNGNVIVPFMSFKKALDGAARLTPRKIKGRGAQTYGQQMKSGVLLDQPLRLNVKVDDLRSETFMCSIKGDSRGIGGRVPRIFPMISSWAGSVLFYITNDTIQQDVFETYLKEAGLFIGLGRFRPENGGVNGRFKVEAMKWGEVA